MSYFHFDIYSKQSSKKPGNPCGDAFNIFRDEISTTIVLSDGIGSGIKANIAANLCVARILGLLKHGATLREAFTSLVHTMNKAWGTTEPFAVFSVVRILNTGDVTVLSYEIPAPVIVTKMNARILSDRTYTLEKAIISESSAQLEPGEGILLVSDGITQAGLGNGLINGWEIDGVARHIKNHLFKNLVSDQTMVDSIHKKAVDLWGKKAGDDCTAVFIKSRKGITVNILTGPPVNMKNDTDIVKNFIQNEGHKIVCGGSTAKMAARELGKKITVNMDNTSAISPPSYKIKGLDLVTEGVVTLNQVYNIIDENPEDITNKTDVISLAEMLQMSDRVVFFTGEAKNIGDEAIEFRQQGILPRKKIIELLSQKLISMGKLVIHHSS